MERGHARARASSRSVTATLAATGATALGAAAVVLRLLRLGGSWVTGGLVIAGAALLWALALRVAAGRKAAGLAALGVLAAALVLATGPFVGRDSLMLAVLGVTVADAAIRRAVPSLPWHRSGRGVSAPAVVVLVVAQLRWLGFAHLEVAAAWMAGGYVLAVAPLPGWTEVSRASLRLGAANLRSGVQGGLEAARAKVGRPLDVVKARWDPLVAAGALLVGGLWAPVYWRLVTGAPQERVLGINDYELHLRLAEELSIVPFRNGAPHPLFHAVTAAWNLVASTPVAATIALSGFTALTYVAVVVLFRRPAGAGRMLGTRTAAIAAAVYFVMETPALAALATGAAAPTTPILTVHWWGNPTWLAGLPFTILTLVVLDDAIERSESGRPLGGVGPVLTIVTVLATLGKPTFTLCMLPAVPVYLVFVRRASWTTLRRLSGVALAPAALVVIWQVWFLDRSDASEFSSGIAFAPIVDAPFGWENVGPLFFAPLILTVAAIALGGREFFADRSVRLTLGAAAVAIPLMLLVTETGERAHHGNFAVPAQGCVALLVLLSVRALAVRVEESWARRSRMDVVASTTVGLLFVAFLAGGVLGYLDATGVIELPIDWMDVVLTRHGLTALG